jgi:hypothetical protein
MRSPQAHPDARVLAIINRALDNGIYEPATQVALVRCFSVVFSGTEWWQDMVTNDPAIAAVVDHATRRIMLH